MKLKYLLIAATFLFVLYFVIWPLFSIILTNLTLTAEVKLASGIYSNQLGLSKSTFLEHPYGNTGDIELRDSQLVIAGRLGGLAVTITKPSEKSMSFSVVNNRLSGYQIAFTENGIRFYHHDALRKEDGSVLINIGAISAWEEIREVDVDSDTLVDFFVVHPYPFEEKFNKAIDINGKELAPSEYEKYYPIFLYDEVTEYPLGSGDFYYQRIRDQDGILKLTLHTLATQEVAYEFFAGKNNRTPKDSGDVTLIEFDDELYTAILDSLFYQGNRVVGFEDVDSALTIYNQSGNEVYREVFEDNCVALLAAFVDEKQSLLLGCSGIIYRYSK